MTGNKNLACIDQLSGSFHDGSFRAADISDDCSRFRFKLGKSQKVFGNHADGRRQNNQVGIFCFVNVSTTMPHSAVNELGAEQWPQAILVLMLIALAFNVIRFFKINKKEDIEAAFKDFFPAIGRFVKSKLFLGMVLVVVMALMYEPVGFMLTCLLFLFAYGLLLGQRNIPMLILSSVIITIILYIGFAVFLGVLLPRGQILPLRNFALFVESLVPRF